jgi:hypothetical protein
MCSHGNVVNRETVIVSGVVRVFPTNPDFLTSVNCKNNSSRLREAVTRIVAVECGGSCADDGADE